MDASSDQSSGQSGMQSMIAMPVNPSRLCVALAAVAVALSVVSLVTNLYYAATERDADRFLRFVDVNGEGNLPTWFSVVLLAAGAAVTAAVASHFAARESDGHDRIAWLLLAAIITAMSLDEMTGMHEAVGKMLDRNVEQLGIGQYAWILPGAVVMLITARVLSRAVWSCRVDVRRRVLFAAALFASAALGLEAVEALLLNEHRNVLGDAMHLLTGAQELLEMLAVVLFLRAMLDQVRFLGMGAQGAVSR